MKKRGWALFIAAGMMMTFGAVFSAGAAEPLAEDMIYFFTKDRCPYCQQASSYIKETYPDLAVSFKNVADKKNIDLLIVCADKFGLDKRRLGTPLICMGNTVVLGWSDEEKARFDSAVKAFLK